MVAVDIIAPKAGGHVLLQGIEAKSNPVSVAGSLLWVRAGNQEEHHYFHLPLEF
jgi:hypothetical protein